MRDSITIRPGEGMDTAVSRSSKAIIMMVDAALGQLKDYGYERGWDQIDVDSRDGFPAVKLNGQTVFEICLDIDPKRGISIQGQWLAMPPRKSRLRLIRVWRWFCQKILRVRRAPAQLPEKAPDA